jgi:hypothetical protein
VVYAACEYRHLRARIPPTSRHSQQTLVAHAPREQRVQQRIHSTETKISA